MDPAFEEDVPCPEACLRACVMALGVPGVPTGGGMTGVIGRWRQQRRVRRSSLLDAKLAARENLRDFRRFTGDL